MYQVNSSFDEVSNRFRKLRSDELNRAAPSALPPGLPLHFLLHDIRSMHNVGSVFRTADAFRIGRIVLSGITACPPHRDIEKTALGATQSVPWVYVNDPVEAIQMHREQGFSICALEQCSGSTPLNRWHQQEGPALILLGNELSGVDQRLLNLCDVVYEIPQHGSKHSLNVSVCAGIAAWVMTGAGSV